ncbi:MAG: hypothetical protein SGARI_004785, partial [Bacillariaceae sp.]
MTTKEKSQLLCFGLGLMTFETACGSEFDLMMASTVRPQRGNARPAAFIPMQTGFSVEKLTQMDLQSGVHDLKELLGSCAIIQHPGHCGLTAITDIKIQSLLHSTRLLPFLEKHLPSFVSATPTMAVTFAAEPTVWQGSIDRVVAFVVAKLTGKADSNGKESHRDSAKACVDGDPSATTV